MRDSINGVWVLGIVMVFMSIFVAYIAISINYSKAYTLKSEMVTIIEQYEGMNNTSIEKIDALLRNNSYFNRLMCKSSDVSKDPSVYGITNGHATLNPNTKQSYCVTRDYREATDGTETQFFYTVTVAFAFDLPLLGDILDFRVSGETNGLLYPNDTLFKEVH